MMKRVNTESNEHRHPEERHYFPNPFDSCYTHERAFYRMAGETGGVMAM